LNCLTSSGLPAPLGVYHRKPKQVTAQLICDDGFRELKTMNQDFYQQPKVHEIQRKPVLSMINKYNIADLSLQNRPVKGTQEGFGAVIVHHPAHHGARRFATETRDNFGAPVHADPSST